MTEFQHHLIAFLTEHQGPLFLVGLALLLAGWIGFFRQQGQINRLDLETKNLWRAVDPLGNLPTLPKIPLAQIAKSDISSKVVLDQKQEY